MLPTTLEEEEEEPGPDFATPLPPAPWFPDGQLTGRMTRYMAQHHDSGERGFAFPKADQRSTCFQWALLANQDVGPPPVHVWNWLVGYDGGQAPEPQWLRGLSPRLRERARELRSTSLTEPPLVTEPQRGEVDRARQAFELAENRQDDELGRFEDEFHRAKRPEYLLAVEERQQQLVRPLVARVASAMAEVFGFTVNPPEPRAWVCCNYRVAEGAAFPDHWWVEIKVRGQAIVIQTVPDVSVEFGTVEDIPHHRDEDHVEVRVPVTGLLPAHGELIKAGADRHREQKELERRRRKRPRHG
ncbi:hypothetical protein [Saccharothrix lopnurensis]|uniref:Uncharacterized protein n=1 Tax=Saccharothrix lopnurensis TaxID=1670621 RepID=A0ABW1NZJ0_9PSEU